MIYTSNKKRINTRFINILCFITGVFIAYYFISCFINPFHKLNYASITGYLLVNFGLILTEKNVKSIEFNDVTQELRIEQKTFFGKEKTTFLNYNQLNYQLKNFGRFLSVFFGKKELIVLSDQIEVIKLRSEIEFSLDEIEKIEAILKSIKYH